MVDSIVKVCPQCGKVNGARRDKCESCGCSLQNVKRVMASSLSHDGQPPAPSVPQQLPAQDRVKQSPIEPAPVSEAFVESSAQQPKHAPVMKKICPICKAINPANITTCSVCGGDLSGVPAIPGDKIEIPSPPSPVPPVPPSSTPKQTPPELKEMVRICSNPDCDHINPAHVNICENCSAPATRLLTRQEAEAELKKRKQKQPKAPAAKSARLVSLDGDYSYQAPDGVVTLGRLGEMREYLREKHFVSRTHAELTFVDGRLSVTDTGSTNGTYVNGIQLKAYEPQQLKSGDTLGLGAGANHSAEDQANAAFFKVELR